MAFLLFILLFYYPSALSGNFAALGQQAEH